MTGVAAPPATASALHVCRLIVREYGPMGLYRGVMPPLLATSALRSIQFGSYAWAVHSLDRFEHTTFSFLGVSWRIWAAGAFSGFVRTFFENPVEAAKVRMQLGQKVTLPSLLSGFVPTMARNVTLCGFFYVAADGCKPVRQGLSPLLNGLFLGSVVATAVWWVIYPFDLIKSQVQATSTRISMINQFCAVIKAEGFRGLFAGVGPGLARSFVGNGAGMVAFELVRVFCSTQ